MKISFLSAGKAALNFLQICRSRASDREERSKNTKIIQKYNYSKKDTKVVRKNMALVRKIRSVSEKDDRRQKKTITIIPCGISERS
ncbi:hypothetical protein EO98_02295 [Methanosarcina sp. 2.H.T.1A.6]|nr:hypothetical protein EO96_01655 [Methanosarcina sp. 2.H.T.1A.8]KKG22276.1 hypothetical protein EO98_02295 [Methanosarcina sp. 2.H.T.1A.6]